ncbi:hypothetical protein Q5752_003523 [Cryptotrichosporon argae]
MSTLDLSRRPHTFAHFALAPISLPRVLSPRSDTYRLGPVDQAAQTLITLASGGMTTDTEGAAPVPALASLPPAMAARRQSRFDPMSRDDDGDDIYGELGERHPLRRDSQDKKEAISLPSIKDLLGSTSPAPAPSYTPPALFHSPGLPSLTNSPGSSSRTSRYSSINSTLTTADAPVAGWWSPGGMGHAYAQPTNNPFPRLQEEEPDYKRRRSDGPPALRDAEESARLRHQAQSRNASYPTLSPGLSATSSAMGSRPSISGPLPSPLALDRRDSAFPFERRDTIFPDRRESSFFDRRDSAFSDRRESTASRRDSSVSVLRRESMQSRSSSFTAPLARSFADLSANDRNSPVELPFPRSPADMMPPPSPARPGLYQRAATDVLPVVRENDRSPRPPSASSSRTRPPTPDGLRRPSLTELIKSQSGDDVVMARGGYFDLKPEITGWPGPRRASADSAASAPSISLNSDSEAPGIKRRHRESRSYPTPSDETSADPMRGMDVLAAESARRAADGDGGSPGDDDDREPSPSKGGVGPRYECEHCAKTFSRPSSLRIHIYSHTGERPFVCPEPTCGRRFSVQSNLKRHAKVHLPGGGPFAAHAPPARQHLVHPRSMHPPPAIYGYPPPHLMHPGHAHPHPAHALPGPHGYALPPPPFAHPHPHPPLGPGPGAPFQPHFQTAPRPPMSEHMQAHYRELQRRRSAGHLSERDEWEDMDEDEEDELEDD